MEFSDKYVIIDTDLNRMIIVANRQVTKVDMAQIATMNQMDTGNINFSDPQFVKYLIENYG